MKKIYILGGGTFSHVRSHLSLATPAFGETAIQLEKMLLEQMQIHEKTNIQSHSVELVLTKMADRHSSLVTNDDVKQFVQKIIQDSDTKAIIFNVALTDYDGSIGDVPSGKYAKRLQTKEGCVHMQMTPSDKLIGMIRKERKDIFVVGFKTTSNESSDIQYQKGLELLKKNSLNLVIANDLVTRKNMIIAPEETRYCATNNRQEVLQYLCKMMLSRMSNTFTRSTVVPGESVSWKSQVVPNNLREVVNHCIEKGAYKPFLGKTAGHFAVKVDEGKILTSIRKTNFNQLDEVGLVAVESKNKDEVIAHGFRPSVGGQSQRIIFSEHPELDCIVHFHCPVKEEFKEKVIPVKEQWPNECGSHECGANTSKGLREIDLSDGDHLSVVYLDEHGPNIVFNRKTPAAKVIGFIDKHFDLSAKTGGVFVQ